jgi:primosomal protein N' (replication factor Y) (superfamily II helicase)
MSAVGRVVRVLVDVPAIEKTFDYILPDAVAGASEVRLGSMVRVPLHGRRVAAWVVGLNVAPAIDAAELLAILKVSSIGPPRELLGVARWAAWRWWGKPATFLRMASPDVFVRGLPPARLLDPALLPLGPSGTAGRAGGIDISALATRTDVSLVRWPVLADPFDLVVEAARTVGSAGLLVLAPQVSAARDLARRLRRVGAPVALMPDDWARAAVPGAIVIGARSAAWAPCASFGAAIVLDEHDEAYQDERAPTWHARDVVVERSRRLGVACLLVSAVPSPEAVALAAHEVIAPDRRTERAGWPIIELVDRTTEEPGRVPIVAPSLTGVLRRPGRVVCVLNRTGRARLLDCRACGAIAECPTCGSAMQQPTGDSVLHCGRCETTSPVVCRSCGGGRMRHLRPGTARLRDDLEALAQRRVIEFVAGSDNADVSGADVLIGTEAVLHAAGRADTVIVLDADAELLAPRMRAGDSFVSLVLRAARLVGADGRVMLVTRQPEHPVMRALAQADAAGLSAELAAPLTALGFAPPGAVARVSGAGASAVADALEPIVSAPTNGLRRIGPPAGPFIVSAPSAAALADALTTVERPSERVRVEVDPVRW